MRRASLPLMLALMPVVLAGALSLGCDASTSSTAPADPSAPSLAVERFVVDGPFIFANDVRQVAVGVSFENVVAFCTTGARNFEQFEVLQVTRPDGSVKLEGKGRDMHVVVWDVVADPCTMLEAPHYSGTAHFNSKDNDVDLTGHGADASGFEVNGTVTDASGQAYHLLANFHGTISPKFNNPEEPFDFIGHAATIELTPIGH